MKIRLLFKILLSLFIFSKSFIFSEENLHTTIKNDLSSSSDLNEHTINFQEVDATELIRFVSKVCSVNFIFNERDLQFKVSLSSGKAVSSSQLLKGLIQILGAHGFNVAQEEGYFVIHKRGEEGDLGVKKEGVVLPVDNIKIVEEQVHKEPNFFVYKLQYHEGAEIQETLKKIGADLKMKAGTSPHYIAALNSLQWIRATNSFLFSGDKDSLDQVKKLIETLDVPLKQVFIEILVIETDAKKASEFGLQWASRGKYKNSVGFGMGNFPAYDHPSPSSFSSQFNKVTAAHPPSGLEIPLGHGFDAGVIGDIILHKGRSFLSLGSLVSALEADGDSSIVLNQKIITQDSKNSTIFVGDNVPFTGSVVQTVGASEQRTANIEYRDIGVTLNITPRLGEGDIITLDLQEEISEIVPHHHHHRLSQGDVNGIQTTKTNMMTHAHIPDKHFFYLKRNDPKNTDVS